tara:strand:- start:4699 stop:4995 length:297 start_codon:yes stop_codon:yes gene_type:complete
VLAALEAISSRCPDRALRLRGTMPVDSGVEAFELVIFRGFSSSLTHPTAVDPDHPVLPAGSTIAAAELLQGPLTPGQEQVLSGPLPAEHFLTAAHWLG